MRLKRIFKNICILLVCVAVIFSVVYCVKTYDKVSKCTLTLEDIYSNTYVSLDNSKKFIVNESSIYYQDIDMIYLYRDIEQSSNVVKLKINGSEKYILIIDEITLFECDSKTLLYLV